ncbi:TlpA family protein disulfide reductase [Negadavirga shengliensis]|uniref:TlpA family protein disulfide reductase n=1 Tax=Negadavirga shengliensis TaxID=1389218 RepID=A0ABV9T550_9BACT
MFINFLLIFFMLFSDNQSHTPVMRELQVISFEEFEGITKQPSDKLRIFNFWATWCAPCVKEMPAFEKINASDPEVEVIFISMDDGRKPERVTAFIEKKSIQAPVYLLDEVDFNSWIDKVNETWSGAIPATLFLKPDGSRFFHEGELDKDELEELIDQLK